jgi:hypothetical protein
VRDTVPAIKHYPAARPSKPIKSQEVRLRLGKTGKCTFDLPIERIFAALFGKY